MKRLSIAILCALAGTAAADRQPLEEAAAAAEELRFEDAARMLDDAWRAGTGDPDRVREVAALAGEISATMGDRAAAMRWFALVVAIDPDASLARGTSPKVVAVLDEARAGLRGARFAVRLRLDRSRRLLRIGHADPLGAVTSVRIRRAPAGNRVRYRPLREGIAIPWRRGAIEIELADQHGNVLHRERRELGPIPLAAAPPQPAPRPPWYARWPTWAGVAGGLGVTAGVLAVTSVATSRELEELHRDSDTHQASEALALERRMQTTAIAAQVAGAGAAVAAAVAVVCWRRERNLTLTPMASDTGGVGAALEVRF